MPSLVDLILLDAQDSSVPVTNLLRRVKVAAVKLKLDQVESWVQYELDGYDIDVPDYRIVSGLPKAFNPFRGCWIPIAFQDPKDTEMISQKGCGQKISELENLLNNAEGGNLQIPFSPAQIMALNQGMDSHFGEMGLMVGRNTIAGIVDAVRNRVLDWALELDKAGITGEDMKFTPQEQDKAHQGVVLNIQTINGFTGNLGVGNTSRDIISYASNEQIKSAVTQIRENFDQLVAAGLNPGDLDSKLSEIEQELTNPVPQQSKLKSFLIDIRTMATGAAGSLAASGVEGLITKILGG